MVTDVLVAGGSTGGGSTGAGLVVAAGFEVGFGFVTVEPDVFVTGLFCVGVVGVLGACDGAVVGSGADGVSTG